MKNLLVLVSSNREIHPQTTACVTALRTLGASYAVQRGSPDVALARNLALSLAVDCFKKYAELEIVLMVDDDMMFDVAQAEELVAHVERTKHAASGVYATSGKTTACTCDPELISKTWAWAGRDFEMLDRRGSWFAGCGFLAIHRVRLLELAALSQPFTWNGKECYGFTMTHVGTPGRWWSEDYWLSLRLGGVDVLPMAIGHIKPVPIYPDDHTLALIARGEPLPADDGTPLKLTQR